jgi:IclR family transcriptional regulator, KDG regulon repressor
MKQETMKSLKKSLDILNLFLSQNTEMTLGEISKLSGLNSSTASRIVAVLVKYNYLKHRERKGKYSLGPIYLHFARLINTTMEARTTAIPYLAKLSQRVGEPVVLAFENGIQELFSEQISDPLSPPKLLSISPSTGTRTLPLHCTSLGKIILASLPDKDLQRYFNNNKLEKYTPNSITAIEKMQDHLNKIKKLGIAFDSEEYEIGVTGVSAPLINFEKKTIGAIGVTAPTVRINRINMKKITPLVKTCAMEISRELGFQD